MTETSTRHAAPLKATRDNTGRQLSPAAEEEKSKPGESNPPVGKCPRCPCGDMDVRRVGLDLGHVGDGHSEPWRPRCGFPPRTAEVTVTAFQGRVSRV